MRSNCRRAAPHPEASILFRVPRLIDCQCGDEWRESRQFCERHQMLYCRRCEGRCPDCRYTDSWEDDELWDWDSFFDDAPGL